MSSKKCDLFFGTHNRRKHFQNNRSAGFSAYFFDSFVRCLGICRLIIYHLYKVSWQESRFLCRWTRQNARYINTVRIVLNVGSYSLKITINHSLERKHLFRREILCIFITIWVNIGMFKVVQNLIYRRGWLVDIYDFFYIRKRRKRVFCGYFCKRMSKIIAN